MLEEFFAVGHGAEFAVRVIFWGGAADVGHHPQRGIQDGDESPAVAVLRPIVAQVRHEIVIAHATDLPGIAAGQGDGSQGTAVGAHAQQMLLVAHGDEQGRFARTRGLDHSAMGPPMNDAPLRATEDLFELPVGPVVENVIASIAIEHEELAVGQVQGPGRTVFVGLGILAGILRQRPFLKDLAVWSGLDDLMPLEVGQVEHFSSALGHQRETVSPGKLSAPLVDQPPFPVVHDDVVLRLVGKEEDVPLTVHDEPMAVIDRRGRPQIPPSGNHPVAERPMTQKC